MLPKLNDLHPKGRNGKALDVTSAILFWAVCSQSLRCLAQPCYRQSLADGAVRGELRVAVRCAGQSVVASGQRNWWAHRLNGHRTCVARTFTHGMVEHGVRSKYSSAFEYQHLTIYCLCNNAFEFCFKRGLELDDKFE